MNSSLIFMNSPPPDSYRDPPLCVAKRGKSLVFCFLHPPVCVAERGKLSVAKEGVSS